MQYIANDVAQLVISRFPSVVISNYTLQNMLYIWNIERIKKTGNALFTQSFYTCPNGVFIYKLHADLQVKRALAVSTGRHPNEIKIGDARNIDVYDSLELIDKSLLYRPFFVNPCPLIDIIKITTGAWYATYKKKDLYNKIDDKLLMDDLTDYIALIKETMIE